LATASSGLEVELGAILPAMALNDLGVSENSVPLNPMVNDHYPY
jgi:hypothetical protein